MSALHTRRTVLACALLVLAPGVLVAQAKPRVAVLSFANNTTASIFGDQLGAAASDELTTQLVRTGQFSVIERERVQALLAEQSLGMSGAVEPETAAKVGGLLGAQLVVSGSITQFSVDRKSVGASKFSVAYSEAESKLDVRVVNVSTGEIIAVAEGTAKQRFGNTQLHDMSVGREFDTGLAQEALRPAVSNAVNNLMKQREKIAAAAASAGAPAMRVVGMRDGQIYIDAGENGGLRVGQRLTVTRVVDVIRDARGNVLDEVTEKVGTVEVKRVLTQSAICELVEGTDVKEGDRVGS